MNLQDKFDDYKRLRLAAKDLWTEVFGKAERVYLVNAAKTLGIWEEPDQLLVEDEYEFDLFTEFYLFNFKIEGETPVEIYTKHYTPDDKDQKLALESGVNSKSSLFLVKTVKPDERSIFVIDLLDSKQEYEFMDFTMSQDPYIKGGLLFTRILPFSRLNMLTGSTMPFPPTFFRKYRKLYAALSRKYRTKDQEIKKFQIFWHLYLEYGLPMRYEDLG